MANEEFIGGIFDSPPGNFVTDKVFLVNYNLTANTGTFKYYSTNGFPSPEKAGTYMPTTCPAGTAGTVTPDGPDRFPD